MLRTSSSFVSEWLWCGVSTTFILWLFCFTTVYRTLVNHRSPSPSLTTDCYLRHPRFHWIFIIFINIFFFVYIYIYIVAAHYCAHLYLKYCFSIVGRQPGEQKWNWLNLYSPLNSKILILSMLLIIMKLWSTKKKIKDSK